MDTVSEVRVRCIEAAAKFPQSHKDGYTAGVQEMAAEWAAWILAEQPEVVSYQFPSDMPPTYSEPPKSMAQKVKDLF
jgi:hypothetical protein